MYDAGGGAAARARRRSLAEACSTYLGVAVSKAHQQSDWSAPSLSRGQTAYAAADAVLCSRLWTKVARELKAKGRDQAYRLQRDCLPAAAAMELRGIALDLDAHAALCDAWARDLADARQAWAEATGTAPPGKPAEAAQYLGTVPARRFALALATDQHGRAEHRRRPAGARCTPAGDPATAADQKGREAAQRLRP